MVLKNISPGCGVRASLMLFFFNPQSLSVAYPVRSGYVLGYICWRRSIKDERDVRTSRMGLRTIRTLMDEPRMRYGRAMDTKVRKDFNKHSNSLIFL